MVPVIYIGVGSNLSSERHGSSMAICQAAVDCLSAYGQVVSCSPWYESAPVPVSDQPWFVNGVVCYQTALEPLDLLERLHAVEARFGRMRHQRNEARILDLDLLAYDDWVVPSVCKQVRQDDKKKADTRLNGLAIPHPRMHQRAFVLLPLRDIAPDWTHPVTGQSIGHLIESLPDGQDIRPIVSVD